MLSLASCGGGTTLYKKPVSKGRLGTLVVVTDKTTHRLIENSLDSVFGKTQLFLPTNEPYFSMIKPEFSQFRNVFADYKSVVMVVTQDNFSEAINFLSTADTTAILKAILEPNSAPIVMKDFWASPQHVLLVCAPNAKAAAQKMIVFEESILNSMLQYEKQDFAKKLFATAAEKDKVFMEIKKKFGLGVRIPSYFKKLDEKDDFLWYEHSGKNHRNELYTLGILIHQYPYKDTADFQMQAILDQRDTFLKYHVPGDKPGTYMATTDRSDFTPFQDYLQYQNMFGKAIRGWWTVRGDWMAGPFTRFVVHNKERNALFVVEGFVYSPNENKTEHLRLYDVLSETIQ